VILMIDNYDSFTYNLVQILAAAGAEVEVVRNDAASVDELLARRPAGIVLSPGPGRPEDAGVCLELLGRLGRGGGDGAGVPAPDAPPGPPGPPVLGVCLGHQALGAAFGARIVQAPELMHGKTSAIRHDGREIFAGLPSPFDATRYHSLVIAPETLPAELEAMAWSDDGVLQAVRHRRLPWWGVQFHPESILTEAGPALLANFLRRCDDHRPEHRR
jgi:anthranilate synthase/aminodeoxychorismate synthase-like glutamine amidotransferase